MIRNQTASASNLEDEQAAGKDDINEGTSLDCNDEDDECLKQFEEAANEFQAFGILYHFVQNSPDELDYLKTMVDLQYDQDATDSLLLPPQRS